jgi:hypothetical protein
MRTALILHRSKYPVFSRQTPSGGDTQNTWRFVENEIDLSVRYDSVIVYSNISSPIRVRSKTKPVLVTGEPEPVLRYPKWYTDQFGLIVTTQGSIENANVVRHATCTPWFIGVSAGTVNPWQNVEYERVDEILGHSRNKTRVMSMVTSRKALTKGHRARLRFALKAARTFSGELDLFGHGLRPISDKGEALWEYRYHIAVENCVFSDYWTEKIADPFLAGTYPIYHGCPNIFHYFPEGSARVVDIYNAREAIGSIRQLLNDGISKSEEAAMLAARDLVLGRYNFTNFITEIVEDRRYAPTFIDDGVTEILPFNEEWIRPNNIIERLAFRDIAWRLPRVLVRNSD